MWFQQNKKLSTSHNYEQKCLEILFEKQQLQITFLFVTRSSHPKKNTRLAILYRLTKSNEIYGTAVLMDNVKCLRKQVWPANFRISLLGIVTTYHWMLEKWALLTLCC